GDLLGVYILYNLYEQTQHNESYKGIYTIEIKTSILKLYYPYEDVVNSGPFGNGTFNFTINIHFENENFETKYLHTSLVIWLHVKAINTTLSIDRFERSSILGVSEPVTVPVFPFGVPGSYYYFKVFLNYSTQEGEAITQLNFKYDNLSVWNGTHWKPWENGKLQHIAGVLQELKIYTDTQDTELLPWNGTGYKNVTLWFQINKTNYQSQSLIQTVFLRKHNTTIQWCDDVLYDPIPAKNNDTTKYFNPSFKIYFRYIDLDQDSGSSTYSAGEYYITYADVNYTNWNRNWATISETAIPGLYELTLSANYDVGTYNFSIIANDTSPLRYRNDTIITFSLTITPANTTLTLLYQDYIFFEYDLFELTLSYKDEYGSPISDAKITMTVLGASGMAGIFIPVGAGIFKAQIINWALPPGMYMIQITAEPTSQNYEPATITTVIMVKGITQHQLFFWGMIGLAGLVGFVAYRQIKWWVFTPYPVKQMVRTRKIIKKKKEISTKPTVRDRKDLFRDNFKEDWEVINLKAPTMVSSEVVAFAKEISDIKRTRVTTTEAKQLMMELQSKANLQEADAYLESLMIPPEARRSLLTIAGLIKYKKPEILDFSILLSEIKGREYTYDDGEKIYNKLKGMKPSEADAFLWNTHLISTEDRIKLLDTIGISTVKLKKKRRKEIQPMTEKEIKAELRSIPGLSFEDRKDLFEKIKMLSPKDQRKFIGNLHAKVTKKKAEEAKKIKKAEKPKKGFTHAQLEKELAAIPGLSAEDRKMMKESILLLSPEEQKQTLDDLKKQYLNRGEEEKKTDK
ncbi:MAG: hypothetical protein ACTSO9_16170, partial [Candidatus Helarchaeota archaeon]